MKALDWIFALVKQHVPVDSEQLTQMQIDGQSWYNRLGAKDADGEVTDHPLLVKLKKLCDQWWFQLLLAVSFIFVNKQIHEYMVADRQDDEPDDEPDDERDDYDDDDRPTRRGRR